MPVCLVDFCRAIPRVVGQRSGSRLPIRRSLAERGPHLPIPAIFTHFPLSIFTPRMPTSIAAQVARRFRSSAIMGRFEPQWSSWQNLNGLRETMAANSAHSSGSSRHAAWMELQCRYSIEKLARWTRQLLPTGKAITTSLIASKRIGPLSRLTSEERFT